MIAGIGIDIVEHGRMARLHQRFKERLASRILDDLEMHDYRKAAAPARFLAKRFAAKEAAVKALGTGFINGITFKMVRVRHDKYGKPLLELAAEAAERAQSLGIDRYWLSISDEQNNSVAVVVLEAAT